VTAACPCPRNVRRIIRAFAEKPAHAQTVAELSAQLRAAVKTTFPADGKTPELKAGLWAPLLAD
jgi:iduronate 2-sulfatase